MSDFKKYLYDRRIMILWAVLCAAFFFGIMGLYGMNLQAVWYPLVLCGVISMGFLLWRFSRYRRRHRELERLRQGEGPYGDFLPAAVDEIGKDYQEIIQKAESLHRRDKEKWEIVRQDVEDYYAVWVHQIKAPIAVMRVLLQQEDTRQNRELSSELFRIEQYVEMALCYVRLGDDASDLVIEEYDLDEIVRKAVRKYAGQFIRKKIRLVYEGTDVRVLTDEKWLAFILEQLLSNAVKYTAEGAVTITVNEKKRLSVSDTGIGISAEDLPRIFEKGYTGYNGRVNRKSTGIGLYLCRTAADRLGHKLTVCSEPGKGSCFTIDLDSYPLRPE